MKHQTSLLTLSTSLCLLIACTASAQVEALPVATSSVSTTTVATTTPEAPLVVTPSFARVSLGEAFQTRLTNLAANVSNRLDALARRIDNVTQRLDSRANKLSTDGKDVTAARAKITIAKNELAAAKADLDTIDVAVKYFVGSTDPYESWLTLKITYSSIRDHLKAAHSANIDTLLLLQTAGTPPLSPITSTSTATTTE